MNTHRYIASVDYDDMVPSAERRVKENLRRHVLDDLDYREFVIDDLMLIADFVQQHSQATVDALERRYSLWEYAIKGDVIRRERETQRRVLLILNSVSGYIDRLIEARNAARPRKPTHAKAPTKTPEPER